MNLSKNTVEKICNHALNEYPGECCGVVTGDRKNQIVHECENIQNKMHAEDPVRFPRDARTAYFIERSEFDRMISYARDKGGEVIALYHSHIEHEAYFSEEDFAAQTVLGEPEFPDALHVVVSVMGGKIHGINCFKWDRDLQNFTVLKDTAI